MMCFTSKNQHQLLHWIPLAKWWYNTTYHEATKMTPYEAVSEQLPPSPISYILGCSKVHEVDQLLQNHSAMISCLKDNLHQAQNQIKQHANQIVPSAHFKKGVRYSCDSNHVRRHLSKKRATKKYHQNSMGLIKYFSV